MLSIEKVVRNINGEEKVVTMAFGTGRLTADPAQPKELSNGKKVLQDSFDNKLSIAFNVYDKEKKEQVGVFYPLQLWERNADRLAQYGYKGREIEIRGRIITESFKKKDGTPFSREVLVVESFELRGPNKEKAGAGVGAGATNATGTNTSGQEEDIPF